MVIMDCHTFKTSAQIIGAPTEAQANLAAKYINDGIIDYNCGNEIV